MIAQSDSSSSKSGCSCGQQLWQGLNNLGRHDADINIQRKAGVATTPEAMTLYIYHIFQAQRCS